MVHAALLLLMLEAVTKDLVFTISLKRSTQNLQLSTSWAGRLPHLRLLPAGAVAGWGSHPLENAALSRRTPEPDIEPRHRLELRCDPLSFATLALVADLFILRPTAMCLSGFAGRQVAR